MLNSSSIATLDKQLAKAEADLVRVDASEDRAKKTIANAENLREELRERVDYLKRVRARKVAELPVAAADPDAVVLNTEAEAVPAVEVPAAYAGGDPRLGGAYQA